MTLKIECIMKPTSKNKKLNKGKIKLGKKTNEGYYEYASKIDFNLEEDISKQISKLIKEKIANDELRLEIEKIKKKVKDFSKINKEKNILYYYTVGKSLAFIDSHKFKDVALYSILRRISEEIEDILPNIKDPEVMKKHLEVMYNLGHIKKKYIRLKNIAWNQWYEIGKFKKLCRNEFLLKKVLKDCKSNISGPALRKRIKILLGG